MVHCNGLTTATEGGTVGIGPLYRINSQMVLILSFFGLNFDNSYNDEETDFTTSQVEQAITNPSIEKVQGLGKK